MKKSDIFQVVKPAAANPINVIMPPSSFLISSTVSWKLLKSGAVKSIGSICGTDIPPPV